MTPDPAQVAAQITGCESYEGSRGPTCWEHLGQSWPCRYLDDATEVVRVALEQAWDDGCYHGGFLNVLPNPYRKEEAL